MQGTVCVVSAEMMIPELGGIACSANQRGGLGDLMGHVMEGFVKKGIRVIPITYFYHRAWQTGSKVDYNKTPARFLFNLDIDIYWQKRSVPVFAIDRAGARVYGINDPEAGVIYPDTEKKVGQAALLGRAVHALLRKINERPDIVWCQEWLTMPVIPNLRDDPFFSGTKFVFTLHTSVYDALDTLPFEWYEKFAIDGKYYEAFIRDETLDPTLAGVRLADMVTGVSEEHGGEVRRTYPEYSSKIIGIMNGTSRDALLSPHIKALKHKNPYSLWAAHLKDKAELCQEMARTTEELTGEQITLNQQNPTIVLFRREVRYKNRRNMFEPNIHAICAPRGQTLKDGRKGLGANVIFGGVAHENDSPGKETMAEYLRWMEDPELKGKFVYLPIYSAEWRSRAIRGSDIHVECPIPRCEACGTSWMVAKLNGIPNVATLGGGHKGHSIAANPTTGTGDTLFLEPYKPETLYRQLGVACDWYYDWLINQNDWWLKLKMNNFLRGEEVDITRMIENYTVRSFEILLAS